MKSTPVEVFPGTAYQNNLSRGPVPTRYTWPLFIWCALSRRRAGSYFHQGDYNMTMEIIVTNSLLVRSEDDTLR